MILPGGASSEQLANFDGFVSWAYNYQLTPDAHHVDWINRNEIEFVPMWAAGRWDACDFTLDNVDEESCSIDVAVEAL
jgi:hypothetical protein